jgi:hypothetical protein
MLRPFCLKTLGVMVISSQLALLPCTQTSAQNVNLPAPDPGSFGTAFDFLFDGRLVAFTGFNVRLQQQPNNSVFNIIAALPPNFLGGSDPAFVVTSPNNLFFLLGTGAGGSKFPNEPFNGSVFILPRGSTQPQLVANIPFHAAATFRTSGEVFINRGEASFSKSAVVRLSLLTKKVETVIDNIPGASGGVGFDRFGNLYTGIGFDPNRQRTGEIRRFSRRDLRKALRTGVPLKFEDGKFVAQVLSAGGLVFDLEGDLWVSGGDLLGGGQKGFIAEVNPRTGKILRRIDPTDGNPNSGPDTFFAIAIAKPVSCTLGAVDSFDSQRNVYKINACQILKP